MTRLNLDEEIVPKPGIQSNHDSILFSCKLKNFKSITETEEIRRKNLQAVVDFKSQFKRPRKKLQERKLNAKVNENQSTVVNDAKQAANLCSEPCCLLKRKSELTETQRSVFGFD